MTMARTESVVAIVLISFSPVFGFQAPATGQGVLAHARDLYTSAAYDEALAVLREYRATPAETVEAEQYRAFCLIALGKIDDAAQVIEQIITANPSFRPPDAQASPRVRDAFRTVRRRMLPAIVRQAYTDAREAFTRSDLDVAAKAFDRVVTLLNDPDVADNADLADLRLLSKGFGELIAKTTATAAPAAAAPPSPREPQGAAPPPPAAPSSSGSWNPDHVYGADDSDVTPPIVISQVVPTWRPMGQPVKTHEVTAVILIDKMGSVASVRLQGTSHNSSYDSLLREAASHWKYQPAMRAGRPVRFQKVVAIRLEPSAPGR